MDRYDVTITYRTGEKAFFAGVSDREARRLEQEFVGNDDVLVVRVEQLPAVDEEFRDEEELAFGL